MRLRGPLLVVCSALLVGLSALPASATLHADPISSVFLPLKFATQYSVHSVDTDQMNGVTYLWTLELKLVDKAGAPSPAMTGSGAAVDPTCNNRMLAGGISAGSNVYVWANQDATFLWYHGDAGMYPGSTYGCGHMKMGPSGHQGEVSVKVLDGSTTCTASINGTDLTPRPLVGGEVTCSDSTSFEKQTWDAQTLIAHLSTAESQWSDSYHQGTSPRPLTENILSMESFAADLGGKGASAFMADSNKLFSDISDANRSWKSVNKSDRQEVPDELDDATSVTTKILTALVKLTAS